MRFLHKNEKYILCITAFVLLLSSAAFYFGHVWSVPSFSAKENVSLMYSKALVPAFVSDRDALDLNTATRAELEALPGIGHTLAERVVAYREEHGAFLHPAAIMQIKGIGEKKYEAIHAYITVK